MSSVTMRSDAKSKESDDQLSNVASVVSLTPSEAEADNCETAKTIFGMLEKKFERVANGEQQESSNEDEDASEAIVALLAEEDEIIKNHRRRAKSINSKKVQNHKPKEIL